MRHLVKSGLLRVIQTVARVRPRGAPDRAHVLTYHQVLPRDRDITDPYNQVSRAALERQVTALVAAGLRPLTISELWRRLQAGEPRPGDLVALSFDDGLEEHLEVVAPLLARLGARATFYIPSACLGRDASEVGYAGRHLDAGGLRQLAAAGFEIGSHSRTHPVLARCDARRLRDEVAGSREDLAGILGSPPASFAYPFGSRRTFTPAVVTALADAGYATAACTVIGGNPADVPPFELRRVPVYQSDDGRLAVAKAQGAMDWLGAVQESWLRLFPHHSTR